MGMSNDFKDKVQLVVYLANKFKDKKLSIIKAVKLIFLADVYAMRNYGTLLSEDEYFALAKGPMASMIENIIRQKKDYIPDSRKLSYIREYLKKEFPFVNIWNKIEAIKQADEDYLSDLDKESIDFVFSKYGGKTERELINITHKYSAWKNHEQKLKEGKKRINMDVEDLFENDGEIVVNDKILERSKRFYGRV